MSTQVKNLYFVVIIQKYIRSKTDVNYHLYSGDKRKVISDKAFDNELSKSTIYDDAFKNKGYSRNQQRHNQGINKINSRENCYSGDDNKYNFPSHENSQHFEQFYPSCQSSHNNRIQQNCDHDANKIDLTYYSYPDGKLKMRSNKFVDNALKKC